MLYNIEKKNDRFRSGVTLVEMMVAVSITVMMLMAAGMIFKSAAKASSKSMASNEMMRQVRSITKNLEQDFYSIQRDMPTVIVFEAYLHDPDNTANNGDEYLVRRDRMSFFTNGDYQSLSDEGFSGNLAQVFYGQMNNSPSVIIDEDIVPPPDREILTRRQKVFTSNTTYNPYDSLGYYGTSNVLDPTIPEEYDQMTYVTGTIAAWKAVLPIDYETDYFNVNGNVPECFVRRPDFSALDRKLLQQLMLAPDVTGLKIQMWNGNRWFPNERDMEDIVNTNNTGNYYYAFYWNTPSIANIILDDWNPYPSNWSRPTALKFTFTLHDKSRSHYPYGKTFVYIVRF